MFKSPFSAFIVRLQLYFFKLIHQLTLTKCVKVGKGVLNSAQPNLTQFSDYFQFCWLVTIIIIFPYGHCLLLLFCVSVFLCCFWLRFTFPLGKNFKVNKLTKFTTVWDVPPFFLRNFYFTQNSYTFTNINAYIYTQYIHINRYISKYMYVQKDKHIFILLTYINKYIVLSDNTPTVVSVNKGLVKVQRFFCVFSSSCKENLTNNLKQN